MVRLVDAHRGVLADSLGRFVFIDVPLGPETVAVKQYGWYRAMSWRGKTAPDGNCYDVVDSTLDQLYEPEVNIRLGAAFIGQLYARFGREIPITAGAYNGGPRMMARWCEQNKKYPTDEFIELIAFPQTREYAKRVTTIYAKYRYLYGSSPYEIPLTLDTKVGN
jgi:hypothetical protein